MRLHLASPNWPADAQPGSGWWRRFGLPQFLLLSLLVHGLALLLKLDPRPLFQLSGGKSNFSVELKAARLAPVPGIDAEPVRAPERSANSALPRNVDKSQAQSISIAKATTPANTQPDQAPAMDAKDLLEHSKAELNAASRRQMLDPMFAPSGRTASSTPLEKATATRQQAIEHLDGKLIRVTNANGSRYCLQGLPEAATRDIPMPVLSIPMNCP